VGGDGATFQGWARNTGEFIAIKRLGIKYSIVFFDVENKVLKETEDLGYVSRAAISDNGRWLIYIRRSENPEFVVLDLHNNQNYVFGFGLKNLFKTIIIGVEQAA
jgi:hypothetical protein